jgi:1-acyl-sn-glycerol-3-phosphate acyltransferase
MTLPPAPGERELDIALRALAPLRALHSPRCLGIGNVPRRGGVMLAGNHTIYGVLDVPLMFAEIYERRGRVLRSLGDHAHYSVPVWRDLLTRFGTVRGTRDNCAELMAAGEPVLVFPGGGREVMKRKDEAYKLIWKERVGFVRLALVHGYPIVPFGAIGVDDAYDIHLDGDHTLMAPARAIAGMLTGRPEMVPPLATGVGPLPRPERYYFGFGRPIPTRNAGDPNDEGLVRKLRDRVRTGVYAQIEELKAVRAADPERYPPARLRRSVAERLEALRTRIS